MNVKLFIAIFFLIFVAELGDKTQLTVMAKSAAGDKWTVFAAASTALVCSTLIAVLFGSILDKYVDPKYVKIAAGCVFLIFGVFTLYTAFGDKTSNQSVVEPAVVTESVENDDANTMERRP